MLLTQWSKSFCIECKKWITKRKPATSLYKAKWVATNDDQFGMWHEEGLRIAPHDRICVWLLPLFTWAYTEFMWEQWDTLNSTIPRSKQSPRRFEVMVVSKCEQSVSYASRLRIDRHTDQFRRWSAGKYFFLDDVYLPHPNRLSTRAVISFTELQIFTIRLGHHSNNS